MGCMLEDHRFCLTARMGSMMCVLAATRRSQRSNNGRWNDSFANLKTIGISLTQPDQEIIHSVTYGPNPFGKPPRRLRPRQHLLDVQLEQLRNAGCTKIYREKVRGARADRRLLLELVNWRHPLPCIQHQTLRPIFAVGPDFAVPQRLKCFHTASAPENVVWIEQK